MAEVKPGDLGPRAATPVRNAARAMLMGRAEQMRAENMARGPPSTPLDASRRNSVASVASSCASSVLAPPQPGYRLDTRRRPLEAAPWESIAVQRLAGKLRDTRAMEAGGAPSAMILQGQNGGTILQAIGENEDHKVAGKAVLDLRQRQATGGGPAGSTPSTAVEQRSRVAFGAVYEHRDAAGKPRLVGSTNVLPERQFQLDWQENNSIKQLTTRGDGPGSSGHLVWVGIGSGPLGEQEMTTVRQAVVDARSERLKIEKLGSEKPYSRHF